MGGCRRAKMRMAFLAPWSMLVRKALDVLRM